MINLYRFVARVGSLCSNIHAYAVNFSFSARNLRFGRSFLTASLVQGRPRSGQYCARYTAVLSAAALIPSTVAFGDNSKAERLWLSACQAIRDDNPRLLRRILSEMKQDGLGVDEQHPLGWTLLHVAAAEQSTSCVQVLIDAGADVDAVDEYSGSIDMSAYAKYGVLREDQHAAKERAEHFCRRIAPRVDARGLTALHYALIMDSERVVRLLLDAGADPNSASRQGHQPIHLAESKGVQSAIIEAQGMYGKRRQAREKERRRLHPLEEFLHERLVGQDNAINVVSAAVRRKQSGWHDLDHPLVFLFLGSSGIGKTELAKQVSQYLHKDKKDAFIRFDMSEYQQKHEVAKFIGSPPGYVGYDQGGQLTSRLQKFPEAVVLFDEVEKAHPDVLTALLQLFDEGRLTDGQGKTIDCKNAIFIMTSNLAADEIRSHGVELRKEAAGQEQLQQTRQKAREVKESVSVSREFQDKVVRPILKRFFGRDEFLGRINETVYFLPFSNSELLHLTEKELKTWAKRANERHKISLSWDESLPAVLADGYDSHYGARSLKYEVERRVVNLLAAADELNMLKEGCSVHVEVQDHRPSDQQTSLLPRFSIMGSPSPPSSSPKQEPESSFRGKQLRLRIRDGSGVSDGAERYFNV
eukprot:scpid44460/ scgid0898/ Caseinolytic peptidase B protein homolog; Suppressor of potassium transport defect 3